MITFRIRSDRELIAYHIDCRELESTTAISYLLILYSFGTHAGSIRVHCTACWFRTTLDPQCFRNAFVPAVFYELNSGHTIHSPTIIQLFICRSPHFWRVYVSYYARIISLNGYWYFAANRAVHMHIKYDKYVRTCTRSPTSHGLYSAKHCACIFTRSVREIAARTNNIIRVLTYIVHMPTVFVCVSARITCLWSRWCVCVTYELTHSILYRIQQLELNSKVSRFRQAYSIYIHIANCVHTVATWSRTYNLS